MEIEYRHAAIDDLATAARLIKTIVDMRYLVGLDDNQAAELAAAGRVVVKAHNFWCKASPKLPQIEAE